MFSTNAGWTMIGIGCGVGFLFAVLAFGISVVLPPGLPVSGEILTGHVRSIDLRARPIVFAGRVPDPVLEEVRGKLAALLGM